jgi:phenylalanyl-tRNA synthetase alpha chain
MKDAKDRLELDDLERQMESERIDVTMPGLYPSADIGRRHPLSMTMEKAVDIFVSLI